MKQGEFAVTEELVCASIICERCKREFVLLNVIRAENSEEDVAVDQQECDYCPYCGRWMHGERKGQYDDRS